MPNFDAKVLEALESACLAFSSYTAKQENLPEKKYATTSDAFLSGMRHGVTFTCWMFSHFILKNGSVDQHALDQIVSANRRSAG